MVCESYLGQSWGPNSQRHRLSHTSPKRMALPEEVGAKDARIREACLTN